MAYNFHTRGDVPWYQDGPLGWLGALAWGLGLPRARAYKPCHGGTRSGRPRSAKAPGAAVVGILGRCPKHRAQAMVWSLAGSLRASEESESPGLLSDLGHEVPTALLPSLLTITLGAPAGALGIIEGVADAVAGAARFGGGALADDSERRRTIAVGGYVSMAILSGFVGAATAVWQVGILRAGAWASRRLRV
jgi:hypothetical protein